MGRKERSDDKAAREQRDESTVRQVRKLVDNYCPTCGVWYPATSNAHAGH